jgi:predicted 3-demethylubiquinone-9 3-methyltransferase (glyoxalase superfamily)
MQKITPFLWYDSNAEEAVNFYTTVFKNSKVGTLTRYDDAGAAATGRPKGSVMTVSFNLDGHEFTAINAGPAFKLNPSVSFFVNCKTEKEVEDLWNKLSAGGKVLMALDKYPFSEKYGWVEDKFGVSWQVIISAGEIEQKIIPSLMFTKNSGKAEEAINFYTSVFSQRDGSPNNSRPGSFFRYENGQAPDKDSKIAYADFTLEGQKFAAMDGGHMHDFSFNEAVSFVVDCKDQAEVDYFWNKFTADGGEESMCGWLKDKYGVSWQITPKILIDMINDKDPVKAKQAMMAMLQMKKIVISDLEKAVKGN